MDYSFLAGSIASNSPTWNPVHMDDSQEALQKKIGAGLRRFREARGLTQDDVAQQLSRHTKEKYQQSAIGKMERGQRTVTFTEAVYLARIFGIDSDQLVSIIRDPKSIDTRLRNLSDRFRSEHSRLEQVLNSLNEANEEFLSIIADEKDDQNSGIGSIYPPIAFPTYLTAELTKSKELLTECMEIVLNLGFEIDPGTIAEGLHDLYKEWGLLN